MRSLQHGRTPAGAAGSAREAAFVKIVSTAEPFDPATSPRRFTIAAADGISAVLLPQLLAVLSHAAPRIDISVRQLLPPTAGRTIAGAWEPAFVDLEARAMDIAIMPIDSVPARFVARTLYKEDFVIAMRAGHPFARTPTLERYCEMRHLVVSLTGDPFGFVDERLAAQGRSRRIALTVPNFMMALAIIAETDLVAALPRRLAAVHSARFGVASIEAPLPLPRFPISAIATKAAVMDTGVAWLFDTLERVSRDDASTGKGAARSRRRSVAWRRSAGGL